MRYWSSGSSCEVVVVVVCSSSLVVVLFQANIAIAKEIASQLRRSYISSINPKFNINAKVMGSTHVERFITAMIISFIQ